MHSLSPTSPGTGAWNNWANPAHIHACLVNYNGLFTAFHRECPRTCPSHKIQATLVCEMWYFTHSKYGKWEHSSISPHPCSHNYCVCMSVCACVCVCVRERVTHTHTQHTKYTHKLYTHTHKLHTHIHNITYIYTYNIMYLYYFTYVRYYVHIHIYYVFILPCPTPTLPRRRRYHLWKFENSQHFCSNFGSN